jgi:ribosomal RNA-processing protein 1
MLTSGPLQLLPKSEIANDSPKNPKIPNSIRYHITDIYLDELDKVQPFESADEEFASTVEKLIAPFEKLREEGLDKTAKTKARELLDDPRLHAGGDSEDEDEDEDEEDEDEEDEEMDEEESEDE